MNLEAHAAPGADPRSNVRAAATTPRGGKREHAVASATSASAATAPAKVSMDPMHATDRYRLVMPWADRV